MEIVMIGLGIAAYGLIAVIVYWIYSIYSNTRKNKKLLYSILAILAENRIDSGRDVDLQDLYNQADKL